MSKNSSTEIVLPALKVKFFILRKEEIKTKSKQQNPLRNSSNNPKITPTKSKTKGPICCCP